MSKYFDKDFFKFLIGFITIVSVSLIIILGTKLYEEGGLQKANVYDSVQGNP